MVSATPPRLLTVSDIADALNLKPHHVNYALKARGIEPVLRLSRYRGFDAAVLPVLREAFTRGAADDSHA